MIRIECDRCEKPFEVDDKQAGKKAPCPECGDMNRVPEQDAPELQGLPPQSAPEETIRVVRPAMFRAHPFQYTLIVIVFFGGLIGAGVLLAYDQKAWAMALLAPVAAAGIWYLIWWLRVHWWIKLSITNKRTIRQEGIIRRHTSEVLHDHVRNVEIKQTFLQRIFRVGYIGISSAGQKGIEIEVHNIPDPYGVKSIIDQYRRM